MAIDFCKDIPIHYLNDPVLLEHQIRLGVLRLDLLHPEVSGNKWMKLSENIICAEQQGKKKILTFGGAYSNHLVATAAACSYLNWQSIGIVRGWHGAAKFTPSLQFMKSKGMELHFVSRAEYQLKYDEVYLKSLQQQFPDAYIIPEGGNNQAGRKGIAKITQWIPKDVNVVATPIGTGTTFAGLRNALSESISVWGFIGFKNGEYMEREISPMIQHGKENWKLFLGYHFGGFAKYQAPLLTFMKDFKKEHHIPLDFIYTAKMMYALFDQIKKKQIAKGSHIIALHTGGLQGNFSLPITAIN